MTTGRWRWRLADDDDDWQSFRKSRNELKSKSNLLKNHFTAKRYHLNALKKIGTTIHRILNPGKNHISFNPETLNHYYTTKLHEIKSIRSECSTSAGNTTMNLTKIIAEEIASSLTEVINNSIEDSIFPSQWKIARICPIPKTDIPLTSKGFWPISFFPVPSKVYECIIMRQLCSFIEDLLIYSKTN